MKKSGRVNYFSFIINYHIILLIPMLIVGMSTFFVAKNHNYERIMNEVRIMTESQGHYWQQGMSVMLVHYNDCRYSKIYNVDYKEDYPTSYLDIIADLQEKEKTIPFVNRMYFYDEEERIVFTSDGTLDEDSFFAGRCQISRTVIEEASERGMATGRAGFYSGMKDGMAVAFLVKNKHDAAPGEKAGLYLIYTIEDEKLRELFTPRNEAGITQIVCMDETLYSSREEAPEAEGEYEVYSLDMDTGFSIRNLVPKEEIIQESFRYLRRYIIWICISLLVGIGLAFFYSRRRYAMFRNLLDHSAVLQDERNELLAESCLYELLTLEMKRQDSLWKKCLDAGIHIDRANQYIALFPKNEKNETLKEYFVGMKRDDPVSSAYKINVFGNLYIWLVCTDESREEITQKLDAFRQNGAEFEVGRILSDAEKIKETYELAIREVRRAYGNVEDYPKMELEALQEAILAGEDSRIEVLLKNLREIIMQVGDTTAILVSFETFSMLGADVQKLYGLVKEGSFSRKDVLTLYDHAAAGRSAAAREKEKRPVPGNAGCQKRSITEVLTYLHEHVLDPDFSVKHMAACFDTSVSNLSHFFKKNMEVSLSAYVDRIKLDKAKELLRKSNMKIGEIAEILQYGSSTGFSVMFKKYEGMSPKEYRDQETEEE